MKPVLLACIASLAATQAMAQETREMDAHVHGVSALKLAADGKTVEINLLSPGADIVGFEYKANTDEDKDAVEAAIRTMLTPENVLTLPEAADCRLTEVLAHLHGHDHEDEHAEEMHEHAEGEDHGHDDGDDHDHADGDDHDHADDDDHDHADGNDHEHDEGAVHSEFHARYIFACEHVDELTSIKFPFFQNFPNAQEIEAQYVTDTGAGADEIGRDAAKLDLN